MSAAAALFLTASLRNPPGWDACQQQMEKYSSGRGGGAAERYVALKRERAADPPGHTDERWMDEARPQVTQAG